MSASIGIALRLRLLLLGCAMQIMMCLRSTIVIVPPTVRREGCGKNGTWVRSVLAEISSRLLPGGKRIKCTRRRKAKGGGVRRSRRDPHESWRSDSAGAQSTATVSGETRTINRKRSRIDGRVYAHRDTHARAHRPHNRALDFYARADSSLPQVLVLLSARVTV